MKTLEQVAASLQGYDPQALPAATALQFLLTLVTTVSDSESVELKAALGALHGAEVGVYNLQDAPCALDYSAVFTATDKCMRRRGWERIVGVARGRQFVAVYMPRNLRTAKRMECCVAVLNERDLVVASARCNLEPLLELATQRLQEEHDLSCQNLKPKSWR